jgi:hypothetical protein
MSKPKLIGVPEDRRELVRLLQEAWNTILRLEEENHALREQVKEAAAHAAET